MTDAVHRAWLKVRKLEQQRQRRQQHPRIDYYPNRKALAIIESRTGNFVGGDYSSVINAIVLTEIPE